MTLKVYADGLSQPSRAVLLFCKMNNIDFERVRIDISRRQHLSPSFAEVNPSKKVPAIEDGSFKLSESHAILLYLACTFPGVADHWYPLNVSKRARIHSVLDWHHSNLRQGSASYVMYTTLAPGTGQALDPEIAAEAEKILDESLLKIESVWLDGSGRFLLGGDQPSIADLSLFCEIMQLELLDDGDWTRLLSPYGKVQQWVEDMKDATEPHFDDVHWILFKAKAKLQKQRGNSKSQPDSQTIMRSRL